MKTALLLLLLTGPALAQQPAHRHQARPHAAAKPAAPQQMAYYCASGNVVKYHSSPECRGLNRCSARVEPLALSEAQGRMDPCKICH